MNRSSMRAFGIACFLIGASLVLMEQFGINETETINETEYKQKISDLEQQLEKANKQITLLEQSHEISNTPNEVPNVTTNELTETTGSDSNPTPQDTVRSNEVVEATLHIYSGLTAYEIGKKLEDLGIVKNGLELELYLAKPEYAKSIQIGQFELNSSMSIEEIAKSLTGKE